MCSKSLSRLEKTIEPMAEKVDELHATLIGGMDDKIAEIHSLIVSMATPGSSPWLGPQRKDTSLSMAETLISEPHATRKESNSSQKRKNTDDLGKFHTLEIIQHTPESNCSECSPTASPAIPSKRDTRWSDLIPADYRYEDGTNNRSNHRWSAVSDELSDQSNGLLQSPRLAPARRPSSPLGPLSLPTLPPPAVEPMDQFQNVSTGVNGVQPPVLQRNNVPVFPDPLASLTISDDPDNEEESPPRSANTASEQAAFESEISNDAAVHCEACVNFFLPHTSVCCSLTANADEARG